MDMRTIGLVVLIWSLASAGPVAAQAIESRYTPTDDSACIIAETGEPEGQDWVLHRCRSAGGLDAWLLYQDSARLQVAFGRQVFSDYRPWSMSRETDWPIEWRALPDRPPHAAIIRLRALTDSDEPGTSQLAVYRVWPDQSSCYLGSEQDNEAARLLADEALTIPVCPEV